MIVIALTISGSSIRPIIIIDDIIIPYMRTLCQWCHNNLKNFIRHVISVAKDSSSISIDIILQNCFSLDRFNDLRKLDPFFFAYIRDTCYQRKKRKISRKTNRILSLSSIYLFLPFFVFSRIDNQKKYSPYSFGNKSDYLKRSLVREIITIRRFILLRYSSIVHLYNRRL